MSDTLHVLKALNDQIVWNDWKPWLTSTAVWYDRFVKDYDALPFHENEQAAVSVMVGGAARADYLATAENSVRRTDGRLGRPDLWIEMNDRQYWFELKRFTGNPEKYSILARIKDAKEQLAKYSFENNEYAIAGVVVTHLRSQWASAYLEAAKLQNVSMVVRFGKQPKHWSYIYFSVLELGACSKKS